MAKEKKSAKKAAKRKPNAKANKTPALECPIKMDLRTGQSTEASGKLATSLVTIAGQIVEHKASVRKHFADGGKVGDVPEFDPKHFVDSNKSCMTQKEYDKEVDRYNAGEDVEFPPRYNPVVVDLAHTQNAVTLRRGALSKHPSPPKDWDEKKWEEYKRRIETQADQLAEKLGEIGVL